MRARLASHRPDPQAVLDSLCESLAELTASTRIAIYSALPDEPPITPLIQAMAQHHWLLPRVEGDRLHFHRVWEPERQLREGAFGIREPLPEQPTVAVGDIDIFICPGLAFDPQGGRLGRGRGFYDRVLARARENALKIGVGYSCQMVEDACCEAHDIRMNAVLCRG